MFHLVFDNVNCCYKQVYKTPMGSNICPIISLYVMDRILNTVASRLSFVLRFIFRHADDFALAIPAGKEDELLEAFNNVHLFIQFAIELGSNKSIPFLDTRLIRSNCIMQY